MIKVGVTGGIGSGKSIVCKVFSAMGYPVYYADERAKFLVATNKELQENIKTLLGEEAFVEGEYNRRFVAEKVFQDQELLNSLNALIHPKVDEDFKAFVKENESKIVFKESALLFETNGNNKVDEVIYVSAPKALRIQRIKQRDPFRTEEEITNIISKQYPESKAILSANYVVVNDDVESVLDQIEEIETILLV